MARTRAEQIDTRNEIARERAERVAVVFDCHTGPVLGKHSLAEEAELGEEAIGGVIQWMRNNATEIGRLATCQRINGTWVYGWCDVLDDHYQEHYKRRRNEMKSLRVSLETLTQSCLEHPEDMTLARQRASVEARISLVEQEIAETGRVCRALRQDAAA